MFLKKLDIEAFWIGNLDFPDEGKHDGMLHMLIRIFTRAVFSVIKKGNEKKGMCRLLSRRESISCSVQICMFVSVTTWSIQP